MSSSGRIADDLEVESFLLEVEDADLTEAGLAQKLKTPKFTETFVKKLRMLAEKYELQGQPIAGSASTASGSSSEIASGSGKIGGEKGRASSGKGKAGLPDMATYVMCVCQRVDAESSGCPEGGAVRGPLRNMCGTVGRKLVGPTRPQPRAAAAWRTRVPSFVFDRIV